MCGIPEKKHGREITMSMNLNNSKAIEWEREHEDDSANPYSLTQICTNDSYAIYGDGIHENICQRLREYYEKLTRKIVEYEAKSKGELHPWGSKDRKYYEAKLKRYLAENWYMLNLQRLEQFSGNEIEWYVE